MHEPLSVRCHTVSSITGLLVSLSQILWGVRSFMTSSCTFNCILLAEIRFIVVMLCCVKCALNPPPPNGEPYMDAGVVAGIVSGMLLRMADLSPEQIDVLGFLGELMLRLLKMLVLPLVAGSMVAGKHMESSALLCCQHWETTNNARS